MIQPPAPSAGESAPVTPIPQSPPPPKADTANNSQVQIAIAPPSLADNTPLITHLVELINAVYTVAEEGIFDTAYRRITPSGLRKLILDSELALAWLTPPSPPSPYASHSSPATASPPPPPPPLPTTPSQIIGCARVQSLSRTHGVFGMLVCDPTHRGSGTGKKLVQFAEAYCRDLLGKTVMQCELLLSVEFEHPFKVRMHGWYERMGYRVVRKGDFGGEYPILKGCLVTEVEFRVYEKGLV